jgi:putative DNA methylase
MVDDPSAWPDLFPTEKAQDKERQRLFKIIEDLVLWENTTNEKVLQAAREEIWQSWRRACAENVDHPLAERLFNRDKLPGFHDPFAGGGALPLEAQRLGLESYATDLNPMAVLINKSMIEIPPKFAGKPPVNPKAHSAGSLLAKKWRGAQGLADDVRYYGQWMRDEAEKRIGHLYPPVEITSEMVTDPVNPRPDLKQYIGRKLPVIAWLWARTVKSPNPAFSDIDVPLVSSFMLSAKTGKEVYVDPLLSKTGYKFLVKTGNPEDIEAVKRGTSAGKWSGFRCIMSGTPLTYDYIRNEGTSGRIGNRLLAVVLEGDRGRIYISPLQEIEDQSLKVTPKWSPELDINYHPRDIKTHIYGLTRYADLFTPRQLMALTTLVDLIGEARERIEQDAMNAGLSPSSVRLDAGGIGCKAYAEAVGVYLGFAVSKQADLGNNLCAWEPIAQCPRHLFGRQAIPMVWDYAEGNPLGESSGAWIVFVEGISKAFANAFTYIPTWACGLVQQADASRQEISTDKVVSTDPPYYDNIGYADLSDFFYIWTRRIQQGVFPSLFSTLAVPKAEELVATPYRHGGKEEAEKFFLEGMTQAMSRISEQSHPAFPVSIYYAFKQTETKSKSGISSTGWETFLDAVWRAGFTLSGTWPIRTENSSRMMGQGYNALASSIVLVCRKRQSDAPIATRQDFLTALRAELPTALVRMQASNIAPVDLAQAAIGPGIGVYTRFSKVLDASGNMLSIQEALALINQEIDEFFTGQEGDFDADSRWAVTWFEQYGFSEGEAGVANLLANARVTSVQGLVESGIVVTKSDKVRLLSPIELSPDWDPDTDDRLTVWEMTHYLIRALTAGGESAAALIHAKLGSKAEAARELAYRLYTICERKKRSQDALNYNALVQSWPEITRLAREGSRPRADQQATLLGQE